MKKHFISAAVLAGMVALTGCGSDSDTANFSLAITDAPVDSAAGVYVQFTGVELKPSEGEVITFSFDQPRTINLLELQEGNSEQLLTNEQIDAGAYNWMRLMVNAENGVVDSYIEFEDGSQHSLYVPSGSQTGLKLVRGFNVAAGQDADFTIDFDLRKSIANPAANNVDYILKPALRVIDNTEIGEIAGVVSTTTMELDDCAVNGAVVYIYEGSDAAADDLGSTVEPITSANVNFDADLNEYDYLASFIAPGNYTAALTCQAVNDAPETDDEIEFLAQNNVSVEANTTTESSFN